MRIAFGVELFSAMMAALVRTVFLLLVLTICSLAVWPEPSESSYGDTTLWLSPSFSIVQPNGYSEGGRITQYVVNAIRDIHHHSQHHFRRRSNSSGISEGDILAAAISRTQSTIQGTKFIPWKFHPRNATWEPSKSNATAQLTQITIDQESAFASNASVAAYLDGDESYSIEITADGTGTISSKSTIGTIRALQTLEQLFYSHSKGGVYTPYAPISISDSPKWAHRGINLDICRNVFGPDDVKRTLDAMATAKFSRLHVHATDAQSWPLVIPALPELATKGAYQPYLVWTPDDLAAVQQYGLERGISVFIEIDMPGHTASVAHAYPDLIAAFNQEDWNTFSAEPPTGQFKLNSPAVYDFIDTVLGDLLPRSVPYSNFFHTGGDEINVNVYLLDETVGSNSSEVIQPLLQQFVSHAQSLVQQAGLHPIAWEELILDWNLTLTPYGNGSNNLDTIVQVWQSPENLQAVLEKGYRALFGDYTEWYLDCGHGQWINPYPAGVSPPGIPVNTSGGVPTAIVEPFTDYCSPYKNWRHVYVYNPLVNVSAELQHLIYGGEAHLWAEQNDPISMDNKLWPRAAAAAEVLWSGPRNTSLLAAATPRLGEWRERAVLDHGIASQTVSMDICLMGETNCQL